MNEESGLLGQSRTEGSRLLDHYFKKLNIKGTGLLDQPVTEGFGLFNRSEIEASKLKEVSKIFY